MLLERAGVALLVVGMRVNHNLAAGADVRVQKYNLVGNGEQNQHTRHNGEHANKTAVCLAHFFHAAKVQSING